MPLITLHAGESQICSKSFWPSRLPCFLRPTDQLQSEAQDLRSTGEHIPICLIGKLKATTARGAQVLRYEDILDDSLSYGAFDELFTNGKIGSRELTYAELQSFYEVLGDVIDKDRLVIHAQDFDTRSGPEGFASEEV